MSNFIPFNLIYVLNIVNYRGCNTVVQCDDHNEITSFYQGFTVDEKPLTYFIALATEVSCDIVPDAIKIFTMLQL